MDDKAIARSARVASIFIPELKPLLPDISAAVATAERAETVIVPLLARVQAHELGLFDIGPVLDQIKAIAPDVIKAIATIKKLSALADAYAAKVDAQLQLS